MKRGSRAPRQRASPTTTKPATPALAKGSVTNDDPTRPCPEGPQTPSQLDWRPPMDDGSSPTQLDFDLLRGRVVNLETLARRLLLTLPVSAQADFGALLPEPDAEEGS